MKSWMLLLAAICLVAISCGRTDRQSPDRRVVDGPKTSASLSIVLVPHSGTGRVDQEIIRCQQQVRSARNPDLAMEQLGWAFVAKARESFDPGFYKLAEQCALVLESRQPGRPEARLLRGHVLHSLHQFKAAESLARELVAQRGLAFDYGLLGDVLMEQGRLNEAVVAYQQMMDLRPDLHAYTRAAHMRWLKGDVAGAIELMRLAVGAASPRDPESAAWVNTRLAFYWFQTGDDRDAEQACLRALEFQETYAPALLLRGRILLAANRTTEAVAVLEQAARLNPLPNYQWTLADALREAGRIDEARKVETELGRHGAAADPRTFALYLATRGESAETAVRLARQEFATRADVFTHDALAWSFASAGRIPEARVEMERALAEGTEDARLFFHAALIAEKSGDAAAAGRWREKIRPLMHLLLPSERKQLQTLAAGWPEDTSVASAGAAGN